MKLGSLGGGGQPGFPYHCACFSMQDLKIFCSSKLHMFSYRESTTMYLPHIFSTYGGIGRVWYPSNKYFMYVRSHGSASVHGFVPLGALQEYTWITCRLSHIFVFCPPMEEYNAPLQHISACTCWYRTTKNSKGLPQVWMHTHKEWLGSWVGSCWQENPLGGFLITWHFHQQVPLIP